MLRDDQDLSVLSEPLRVLLVEDNRGDAHLVHEYLADSTSLDLTLFQTSALSETLETLMRQRMDAVLLDLELPDSTGLDTISRVQQCDPDVAIVVLTGDTNPRLAELAIARGAQEYILKRHLQPELLSRALKLAVGRARIRKGLRSLLKDSPAGVLVVGAEQVVRYANSSAQKMLSNAGFHLVGAKFPPHLAGLFADQHQLQLPGEEPRWLEITSRSINWYGELAQLFVILEVTEHKRAQALQERLAHVNRLATVGQLAAGVAHEVNNPATYVIGNIAEIKETLSDLQRRLQEVSQQPAPSEQSALRELLAGSLEEVSQLCEETARGMGRIVQAASELRDFSRVGSRTVEAVDVNAALRSACRMTERLVRSKADLQVELGEVPPIFGTLSQLEQVFSNLLINAAQAIEHGTRSSNSVRVESLANQDEVIVRIEDTGAGMSQEVKNSILEPFFTTKPRGVGTGLGLSVSHQIVREHGGRLSIDSRLGYGTVFELRFPIARELTLGQPEQLSSQTTTKSTQNRLLLIGADPEVVAVTGKLSQQNYEVCGVAGWEQARQLLNSGHEVDAILCDATAPAQDPQEIYQALSEQDLELTARLVFCTGATSPNSLTQFIESTASQRLQKPFTETDLSECLERIHNGLVPGTHRKR